ncbi:MAG: glucoamylase family protein [Clostridiaceae bacterium]|nr:glucoamylase family protein [Clostridiaceae bacterium]
MQNRTITDAYRILTRQRDTHTAADAWLRDNHALFDTAYADAHSAAAANRDLPTAGKLADKLTHTLKDTGEPIDADNLCRAVRNAAPCLKEAEIAALPSLLSGRLLYAATEDDENANTLRAVCESLRALQGRGVWMHRVFESGILHRTLLRDPDGVYPRMAQRSQAEYRAKLAEIARNCHMTEEAAAKRVLDLAAASQQKRQRHVGYWILERPLGEKPGVAAAGLYHAFRITLSIAAVFAYSLIIGWWALLAIPAFAGIFTAIAETIFRRAIPRRPIPRMEESHTDALCVVTCLMGKTEKAGKLSAHLEEIALSATTNPNVCFGLLVDWPESSEKVTENDVTMESLLRQDIDRLNDRYPDRRFCLFTRERTYYPKERRYLGWERKRGAIVELVSLMTGKKSQLRVHGIPASQLRSPYLITLDEDTRPGIGSIDVLLAAAEHPLNRPVIRNGFVQEGYGILQPRLETALESAVRSRFAGLLTGGAGFDLYGDAAGEWNTDLYGSTPFTGKGLIFVQAFRTVMQPPFPESAILSHDLPEGELLRAACCTEASFDDKFPANTASYYARLHRWIRGDVQNLHFIFRESFPNRGKGRVIANILRAWLPIILTASLITACYTSIFIALPTVIYLAIYAILRIPEMFRRSHRLIHTHTPPYPGYGAEWLRAGVRLLLLPADTVTALDATIRAGWRMLFTRRGLLEWTTFADAARKNNTALIASFLAGMAALLSLHLPGILLGLAWLYAPILLYALERENVSRETLSDADRMRLREMAERMLGLYLDTCKEEEHWLPPDNVQEQPAGSVAHRTSPTNIGLAMLSLYAGVELGLVERTAGFGLIEHMTDTIEQLPKWNGHLLNWIDTRTLEPLRPSWISTVDSGNLAICLWCVYLGLPWGKTRGKLGKILEDMDFAALYDGENELLYLGYELESGRFSQSHYDLMASEARLASYVAIAMGQIPARHWRRLRRTVTTVGGEGGMASWSGTMFEYFLPTLFLPRVKGSFWDETLHFALKMQQKAAHGGIFGMSESGFFAFDSALAYQYKAHGVDTLSIRVDKQEPVYAPYAAYLALPWEPGAAMKTLAAYDALGMRGRYGLYEALDFDSRRIREEKGMPVRSYMAHHVGMSILSVYHALTDGGAIRLLRKDARFRAFEPCLAERIPYGAEGKASQKAEERPMRGKSFGGYEEKFTEMDALCPRVLVLGNAGYRVTLTDTGLSRSHAASVAVSGELPDGVTPSGFMWTLTCGETVPLTYAPAFSDMASYTATFAGDVCRHEAWTERYRTAIETRVAVGNAAEQRRVVIENRSRETMEATLGVKFRPILAAIADYTAHPAFSQMFLRTEMREKSVLVERARRGNTAPVCLVFGCDAKAEFFAMREDRRGKVNPGGGYLLDTEVSARVPLVLRPGQTVAIRFALGVGETESAAEDAMDAGLKLEVSGASFRIDEAASVLGMGRAEVSEALDLYADTLFYTSNRRKMAPFYAINQYGRDILWRVGISGDFPVLCVRVPDEKSAGRLYELLRAHVYLFANGVFIDCAVLLSDGGDYRRPVYSKATETLGSLDGSNLLGVRGGVHFIDADALTGEERAGLIAQSSVYVDCAEEGYLPPTRVRRNLPETRRAEDAREAEYAFGDRTVTFEGMPPVVWSHVLANRTFGYLATDNGIGFCWYWNARENKLNGWENDPYAAAGPEQIAYGIGKRQISVFSENGDARVTYGMGYAKWEKTFDGKNFSATAFVHPYLPMRVMIFETDYAGVEIRFRTTLLLGADRRAAATVVTERRADGILLARNPGNRDYPDTKAALCMYPEPTAYTCDANAAREDLFDGAAGGGHAPGFAARIPMEKCREGYCAVIILGCMPDEQGISRLHALSNPEKAYELLEQTRENWHYLTESGTFPAASEPMRRYLDGFALYQVIACRLWGRTSLWQNGGAYGFRDQLQDTLALLAAPPLEERYDMARAQILRAAARQYAQGDVQHWWHPRTAGLPRGVRTRISDDLLFLPYLLTRYARVRKDDLPDIRLPYLETPPLCPEEHNRYEEAPYGKERETVYEHCIRALELVTARGTGAHGLLRMGGGDWNDGMDAVRGESVWLTWFAAMVYRDFADFAGERGDHTREKEYRDYADGLTGAADKAFRGTHYLRGYYANGATLGADADDACRLDAIAQAFSVLGGGDRERAKTALKTAFDRLFDDKARLVRLFDQPFTRESRENPGYIKAYPPGTRENGGQYTHGAVWFAWGLYAAELYEEGDAVMEALCPTDRDMDAYRAEPYALCADVYASPAPAGRGGWSLYTGAASWYYTVARAYLRGTGHQKTSDII